MFYGSLGDYSSIRSGSYKKLLSSYYAKTKGTQSSTANRKPYANRYEWNKTNTYANRALTAVKKEADELTASARTLTNQGMKPLFVEKYTTTTDAETGVKTTTKGYDMDAITKAVDTFVSDYNSAVKAGKDSSNTNVVRNTEYMTKQTSIYARSLAEVGITVEKDQTLSLTKISSRVPTWNHLNGYSTELLPLLPRRRTVPAVLANLQPGRQLPPRLTIVLDTTTISMVIITVLIIGISNRDKKLERRFIRVTAPALLHIFPTLPAQVPVHVKALLFLWKAL